MRRSLSSRFLLKKAEPSADSKVVSSKVKVGDSTREAKPNPVVDSAPDEDVKVDAKQDENKVSPVKKTKAESASVVKKASAEGASIVKKASAEGASIVKKAASATIVRKADRSAPASGQERRPKSERFGSRGDTGRPSRPDNRGPRSDSRGPRSDGRGPRSDGRGPRPDNRGPRPDNRGPRPDRGSDKPSFIQPAAEPMMEKSEFSRRSKDRKKKVEEIDEFAAKKAKLSEKKLSSFDRKAFAEEGLYTFAISET